MHLQEINYLTLTLGVKVIQKCCPVPSTSCTQTPAKPGIATCNGLGGYEFTRKYIILL